MSIRSCTIFFVLYQFIKKVFIKIIGDCQFGLSPPVDGIFDPENVRGGPLIADDYTNPFMSYSFLAGIVSFGPDNCGEKGFPGVYTRVDRYIDWIKEHIKSNSTTE